MTPIVSAQVQLFIACLAFLPFCQAAPSDNLGTIEIRGRRLPDLAQSSAGPAVPSHGNFEGSEPRSTVERAFVDTVLAPTVDYASAAQYTPGMLAISPNGTGLSEAKLSFRGLQDGFFNVTFDGIPFGDANDATHHSTSYFPGQFLGDTTVVRGPGGAASVGFATFGGTLGLSSKALDTSADAVYLSSGSWGTRLSGVEFARGVPERADGVRYLVNLQHLDSDGFQSHAGVHRTSGMVKAQQQVNQALRFTVFATYGVNNSGAPTGITRDQALRDGEDHGLGSDRNKGSYAGYNRRSRSADFAYVGVDLTGGGWTVNNKLYTSGYRYGPDYFADTTDTRPLGNKFGPAGNQDVVGSYRNNHWRTVGDLLSMTRATPGLALRGGVWLDQSHGVRFRQTIDFSRDLAPVAPAGTPLRSINYDSAAVITTLQPFVEADIDLSPRLRLTTGIKYAYFLQAVAEHPDATNFSVNTATGGRYHALLPSASLRYAWAPDASLYLQYAPGIQMPPTSLYDVPNNGAIGALPKAQSTRTYQIGGALERTGMHVAWDAFYTRFNNAITAQTDSGGETTYSNSGGATYRGLEAEATKALGPNFSLYLNASVLQAKQRGTGNTLAYAPATTQVAGLLYADPGNRMALLARRTASYYGAAGQSTPADNRVASYFTADLTASHTFAHPLAGRGALKLQAGIRNLFDRRGITDVFAGPVPTYSFQPGRNFFLAVDLTL